MLLNISARSLRDLSLRRAMCQERISRPIALIASLLTAGRKLTKCLPHRFLASLGRNVYPRNLEVTGRILTETMRLYPPVWMSTREVTTKTELAGRVLHPGDTLLYSPYLIHRRADLYPDPDHFDPDRWLPERRATRPAGSYIPFAVGTRRCIGDVFATVEATLVLACVAARWHLQPIPGVPVRPTPRATLRPNTLPMRLHRRRR